MIPQAVNIDGHLEFRAGSNDPQTIELKNGDGSVIDLTDSKRVEIHFKNKTTGATKTYTTDDTQLNYLVKTEGTLTFTPDGTFFTEAGEWKFYYVIVDNSDNESPIPDGKESYTLYVGEKY